jgi:hypothetical protein
MMSFEPVYESNAERPPKEWWYYAYEKVLQKLQKSPPLYRPESPHRSLSEIASAVTGYIWWGTQDGMRPETRAKILRLVKRNRARGISAVVTSKGTAKKEEVVRKVGRAAAARIYARLKAGRRVDVMYNSEPIRKRKLYGVEYYSEIIKDIEWNKIHDRYFDIEGYLLMNAHYANKEQLKILSKIAKRYNVDFNKVMQQARGLSFENPELMMVFNPTKKRESVKSRYLQELEDIKKGYMSPEEHIEYYSGAVSKIRKHYGKKAEPFSKRMKKVFGKLAKEYGVSKDKIVKNPLTTKEIEDLVASANSYMRYAKQALAAGKRDQAIKWYSYAHEVFRVIFWYIGPGATTQTVTDLMGGKNISEVMAEITNILDQLLYTPELRETNPPDKISMKELENDPEFQKAVVKYREFHGTEPMEILAVELPYPAPKFQIALGKSSEAVYKVPKHSRKQSKVPYKHKFEGKVLKVTDVSGKYLADISPEDSIKVTDYIYG